MTKTFLAFVCRVPLVDAKRYVAALRARKGAPPARIFVFNEDTHALDRPQTEFEQWLTTICVLKRASWRDWRDRRGPPRMPASTAQSSWGDGLQAVQLVTVWRSRIQWVALDAVGS